MDDYQRMDVKQAIATIREEEGKVRRGLLEVIVGLPATLGAMAVEAANPFNEMIATPGVEHYIGGTLKYGTYVAGACAGVLVLKGIYDIVKHGLTVRRMAKQFQLMQSGRPKKNLQVPRTNIKSKPLYKDMDEINRLRTKKKPPMNPLLF